MKKKIVSTILAISGLSIIGFAILFFLGLFKEQESGVLIESEPIAKVFINNIGVGETPYEANLKSGEINIKIKPEIVGDTVYDDYETKINLVPGIRTIIKRTFNISDEESSGAIVSFEKMGGQDSFVTVVTIPDGSRVTIDGKAYGYTPLRVSVEPGDHTLVIFSDGYLEKSLPIKVYKGYKLTASVKLAKTIVVEPTPVPLSATDPALNIRIRINKTDTGFLRVRSGANTGFPEVGQVKVGEEYDVIEEGEHTSWYKIKFLNSEGLETEGWVSSEFVTLQKSN